MLSISGLSRLTYQYSTLIKLKYPATSLLQEKEKAEDVNAQARRKLEDFRVPDVRMCVLVPPTGSRIIHRRTGNMGT